ncbi:helix-turn-helix domain-containing protein [Tenacibaculum piscium]|uniref:helix-turn-helix domain-containing protein n=1 Tax=Tenacibaculum piscium TaxID=1458515 RepID=UPI001F24AEAF|nr:helix-turn-helix domain-containing protein [Tenacibaculum piscium]
MTTIKITASDTAGTVKQIQHVIGGTITERWGEYVLDVDSDLAKGSITFLNFEWGGSVLQYDIVFLDDITLIMDASEFNPIHFVYTTEGYSFHQFERENKKRKIAEYQSVIITSKEGGYNYGYFDKNVKVQIHLIQINRIKFINKRLNDASVLNQKLYEVFYDKQCENVFAHYGTYNLKIANLIKQYNEIKQKGIIRILIKEGIVYQILSEHMQQHNNDVKRAEKPTTSLTKKEISLVRKIAQRIVKNVADEYNVEKLSEEIGISQAKMQEGFKLLFSRTVIEYIRHVRLEKAKDLISSTDGNISQIIYSIGFSSRSYFSKIFKRKYGISPSKYLKNKQQELEIS